MAKRKFFGDPDRQRAFRLLVATLKGCRYDTEIVVREAHNPNRPTVIQWPGGGLFPDADLTRAGEAVVVEGQQKEPTVCPVEERRGPEPLATPPPPQPPASATTAVVKIVEGPPDRHFSRRCLNDVVSLLGELERWLTGQAIADQFSVRNIDWSPSTLAHSLAEGVRRGELANRRGQGYGLSQWDGEE